MIGETIKRGMNIEGRHSLSSLVSAANQLLQDRMKHDIDWNMASTSYNPLD
jgi:hypothetical protein